MKKSSWSFITRPVLCLGLASFFADIASETIYPLLPVFITSVLGASAVWLGIMEGVAESISSVLKVFAGVASDRSKDPKRFVITGYGLSTVRSLMGLAYFPIQVLLIRIVDRVGKGLRTAPRDAWLARGASAENRGRVFGFHRAMDNAGATVAPLLATLFLLHNPGEYRLLFILTLIPGIIAVYFVGLARKYSPQQNEPVMQQEAFQWKKIGELPSSVRRSLFAFFLFALACSGDSFLILKFQEAGVSVAWIPLGWALLNGIRAVTSYTGGLLSDRLGAQRTLFMGWILYCFCYIIFAFSQSLPILLTTLLLYGFSGGLIEAPEKSVIAELSPASRQGTAFGFFHLVTGIAILPANFIVGILWSQWGSVVALSFSTVVGLSATIIFAFLRIKRV